MLHRPFSNSAPAACPKPFLCDLKPALSAAEVPASRESISLPPLGNLPGHRAQPGPPVPVAVAIAKLWFETMHILCSVPEILAAHCGATETLGA